MRYSQTHEWISLNGTLGTVGISDYAQKELGEVVYIELPKVGQKICAGEEVCVLESTKAAADVYAPVSGTIVAVNEDLRKNPSFINKASESQSWLFQIELLDLEELNSLMTSEAYSAVTK